MVPQDKPRRLTLPYRPLRLIFWLTKTQLTVKATIATSETSYWRRRVRRSHQHKEQERDNELGLRADSEQHVETIAQTVQGTWLTQQFQYFILFTPPTSSPPQLSVIRVYIFELLISQLCDEIADEGSRAKTSVSIDVNFMLCQMLARSSVYSN